MEEIRKELELLANATQTDLKRAQEKYSIVSAICAQIIEKLDIIINQFKNEKMTTNDSILSLMVLKHEIESYPQGEQCQVAFKLGQQTITTATLQKFDEINLAQKEKEKIEDIKNKIESGIIEPDAKRKGGQRPESLRMIRNANSKLKESQK